MILYKVNGGSVNILEEDIREFWDVPNEGYRKIVVEVDDSTYITYKVTNTVAEIQTAFLSVQE